MEWSYVCFLVIALKWGGDARKWSREGCQCTGGEE